MADGEEKEKDTTSSSGGDQGSGKKLESVSALEREQEGMVFVGVKVLVRDQGRV